ncbi:hypothetical protein [Burkholderia ubonensis]|uniref:hypothetical protein n=1 Tax=Burkholderia ubonensis TaxID=101571 RepID=UPI000AB47E8A|nr:hypothetical protein [Burkholderia ubonensis]
MTGNSNYLSGFRFHEFIKILPGFIDSFVPPARHAARQHGQFPVFSAYQVKTMRVIAFAKIVN